MKRVRWFVVFALALGALALPASAFAARSAQCPNYPGTDCTVPSSVLGITTTPQNPATTADASLARPQRGSLPDGNLASSAMVGPREFAS